MFSDGEATPRASTTDSNVASIEYDKDPINSTIDAVVMRALSDQDSFSSTSISNYFRGSRNRLSTNIQSSTAEQTGTSDRKMMGNNVNNSMRPLNAIKQPGQFQSSQQAQQFSNTDAIEGSGVGASGSHNGQATGNSSFPSSKTLVSASRESFHGGNSEMHGLTLSARQQKDQRISDRIGDQRSNNTAEHHHLTNGHESLNMLKVSGLVY
ncbi:unnamed protein product [Brugia timori]|uniref:Uncharacterized protein n=1 Tax=Brugia timori TaxID=42155 RepID=A0A0R3Q970_9BILA|nr:unnamed protein product [Brugia timori]